MQYMTESELYHHGILGQKWGVRRYQNQDGSYTAAGKERYGIEDGKRRSLKSYALEYKDRRENKNRYSRMKKNQNLDTMSYEEMKRLNDREQLKGQIQWQQKQNDPNAWKKQLGREVLSTAARGLAEGASKELGKQLIAAPIKLAGYAGDKTISAAGWSARQMVDIATDTRRQNAIARTIGVARRGANFAGRATSGLNTAANTVGRGAMGVANRADRAVSDNARYYASRASYRANQAGQNISRDINAARRGLSGESYNYSGRRAGIYDAARGIRRDASGVMNTVNNADRAFSNAARSGANDIRRDAGRADRAFSNAARSGVNDVRRDVNRADRAFSNTVRRDATGAMNAMNNADRAFSNSVRRDADRGDRAAYNALNAARNSANILDRSFSNAVTPRTSPIYSYPNLENGGGSDYMRRLRRGY